MLRHNRTSSDAVHPLQPAQTDSAPQDILELNLQGGNAAEWLIQLVNSQGDYFARQAFSDSFRNGRDNSEWQRQSRYLQEVRESVQRLIREGEVDSDNLSVNLKVSIERG